MRYLGQFPSEAQVRDYILPKMEEDEPCDFIKYEKFEAYMLQVMTTNEFEPAQSEQLLAAFRTLDPQGTGKINREVIKTLLTTKGIPLRKREIKSFLEFALDKTSSEVNYEDYVAKLIEDNERHQAQMIKGYETFKPNQGGGASVPGGGEK